MKTILIPTDFSKAATKAVDLGVQIARTFGSTLALLHVLEGAEEGSFNVEGESSSAGSWENKIFNLKMLQKAKKQMARLEQEIRDAGIDVIPILRFGNAYHGIQAIVTEQKAELIVMGTKGSSGFEGLLVGSNTEKVVRRSACPVLSVNENANITPFKSIVWATSLSDEELTLAPVARKLMEMNGTTVHVVRINTPAWFLPDTLAMPKLNDFAKRMKLKNYATHVFNDVNEEEGLLHFARSIHADLILLATHGRRGLAHLLNGSIAEGVVNHGKLSVLTYVMKKR